MLNKVNEKLSNYQYSSTRNRTQYYAPPFYLTNLWHNYLEFNEESQVIALEIFTAFDEYCIPQYGTQLFQVNFYLTVFSASLSCVENFLPDRLITITAHDHKSIFLFYKHRSSSVFSISSHVIPSSHQWSSIFHFFSNSQFCRWHQINLNCRFMLN